MECWNNGIMGNKSGKNYINDRVWRFTRLPVTPFHAQGFHLFNGSTGQRANVQTDKPIIPPFHYSTIPTKVLFFLILLLLFALYPRVASGYQTERDYRHARLSFEKLLKDPQKQKFRHHWIACIEKFRSVYAARPNGPRADDALFMTARLYAELYGFSCRIQDKQQALDYYNRLLKRFPGSRYASRPRGQLPS